MTGDASQRDVNAGLYPSRDRLALLGAVARGRVYRSHGGCDMHTVPGGQNTRVDRRLRELRDAGWVVLGRDSGRYELTDAGRQVADAAGQAAERG